jgi:hypothetical protein
LPYLEPACRDEVAHAVMQHRLGGGSGVGWNSEVPTSL